VQDCDLEAKFVRLPGGEEIRTVRATVGQDAGYLSRTPIVLLHGMGAGVGMWCKNFGPLARQRPVYAVDLLGFGRSSRVAFPANPELCESAFVRSIEEWRKAEGLNEVILLGHSFGGYLAFNYALRHPNSVRKLILADPWGLLERPDNHQPSRRWISVVGNLLHRFDPLAVGARGWPVWTIADSPIPGRHSGASNLPLSEIYLSEIYRSEIYLSEIYLSEIYLSKIYLSKNRRCPKSTYLYEIYLFEIYPSEAYFDDDKDDVAATAEAATNPESVERAHDILDYIYHCNAQPASGETGFRYLAAPLGFAKRPLYPRLPQLEPPPARVANLRRPELAVPLRTAGRRAGSGGGISGTTRAASRAGSAADRDGDAHGAALLIHESASSVASSHSWLPHYWRPTSSFSLAYAEALVLNREHLRLQAGLQLRHAALRRRDSNCARHGAWRRDPAAYARRRPLLLLHGMGAAVGIWCRNIGQLSRQRPVYAIDILGFGRSSACHSPLDAAACEARFVDSIEQWRLAAGLPEACYQVSGFGGAPAARRSVGHAAAASRLRAASAAPPDRVGHGLLAAGPLDLLRAPPPIRSRPGPRLRGDLRNFFDDDGDGSSGWLGDKSSGDEVLDYVYHCNAQVPSGETGFPPPLPPDRLRRRPCLSRIDQLPAQLPLTVLYGGQSRLYRLERARGEPNIGEKLRSARPAGSTQAGGVRELPECAASYLRGGLAQLQCLRSGSFRRLRLTARVEQSLPSILSNGAFTASRKMLLIKCPRLARVNNLR
uniref:AB hydrolase-1 domain-containing protein n=1 Tax=Macrostomum lignano TaxID=282301 RepID=A0A1I8F9V6_9PLAT